MYRLISESQVKFIANGHNKYITLTQEVYQVDELSTLWVNLNPRRFLDQQVREALKNTLQEFDGRKYMHTDFKAPDWWDKKEHCYGFPLTSRNEFLLDFCTNKNPYLQWEKPLLSVTPRRRELLPHQQELLNFMATRRHCIIAAEMGCLSGDSKINGKPIRQYHDTGELPIVKSYDRVGNIVTTKARRIIKKRMPIVVINERIKVGHTHLFLTNLGFVMAKDLTTKHRLFMVASEILEIPTEKLTSIREAAYDIVAKVNNDILRQFVIDIVDTLDILGIKDSISELNRLPWTPERLRHLIFLNGAARTVVELLKILKNQIYPHQWVVDPIKTWLQIDSEIQEAQILAESVHRIPKAFINLNQVDIESLETRRTQDVFDLTVPEHGNYFDDYGINHQNTGKTLAVIEFLEYLQANENLKNDEVWYIAPVSGVRSTNLELAKWKSLVRPTKVMTYDALRETMRLWTPGTPAPKVVIFDESSKLKTWNVKRTKAAFHLAEAIRMEHGFNSSIILMSGTPAPKTPLDWWSQCEITRPGFVAEPSVELFKARLSIVEKRDGVAGGSFMHTVTYLNDERKCRACGQYEDHINHKGDYRIRLPEVYPPKLAYGEEPKQLGQHYWEPSVNEVHRLADRLRGLVKVIYKKDCLSLPDKMYRVVRVKPNIETIQAAKMLQKIGKSAAITLMKLRELSDGFSYVMTESGEQDCDICKGKGMINGLVSVADSPINNFSPNTQMSGYEEKEVTCDACSGQGKVPKYSRETATVECPKDEVVKDYLEEQEDTGRIVLWGAFTGTIERLTKLCLASAWNVLKIDGKGWVVHMADPNEPAPDVNTALKCFDASHPERIELLQRYERFAVVGNPQAGGMGLTLTAAQVAIYYSNPFNGEARIQSEDRLHRTGMDANRSPVIVDIIHLPSDLVVLENLKNKRRLQDMSMGELISQLDKASHEVLIHESN